MKDSRVQFVELCQTTLKASENVKRRKIDSLITLLSMQVSKRFQLFNHFLLNPSGMNLIDFTLSLSMIMLFLNVIHCQKKWGG